jgi:hypothetical protein
MSAPHQLTDDQRNRLLNSHHSLGQREKIRFWLLSQDDLDLVNDRRREHNRLGFAVQLCLLRYPGRPLQPNEQPPRSLLEFVARQLAVEPEEFGDYAQRDQTRQEHQQILTKVYQFYPYGSAHAASLRIALLTEALSPDSAFALVKTGMEWLRERKVILPALATLEALVGSVRATIDRQIYWRLEAGLGPEDKARLDKMLEMGPSKGSLLGWLRRVPSSCSAAGIPDLVQRLTWVRDSKVPGDLAEKIGAQRLRQLAARGARHSVGHFRRFPPEKRHSILAAFLLQVSEELTDRVMDFHRRLIGRMFREAEKKQWTGFVSEGAEVNRKLHNYSRLATIITRARREGRPLEAAIETEFGWDALELDRQEAVRLAKPLESSAHADFRGHFPQFRQYTPKFLEVFQFEAIPARNPLLKAWGSCAK